MLVRRCSEGRLFGRRVEVPGELPEDAVADEEADPKESTKIKVTIEFLGFEMKIDTYHSRYFSHDASCAQS